MKLVLAALVSVLTACSGGGGSSTTETPPTTAATPTPAPSPTPTPTPAPTPSPTTSQGALGKIAWGKNQCAGCHGGNTSKGANAALTMSSMTTVQKHKDAYGATAISGWGITVSQEDADNIAVYAANPSAY
jgi:mono/diheme cytochrome c family protein